MAVSLSESLCVCALSLSLSLLVSLTQIYRIKYCTGPLSLSLDLDPQDTTDPQNPEVETHSAAGIRSPSDLYRAFASEGVAVGGGEGKGMGDGGVEKQQRPRGILKKATSLPCQGK